MFGSVLVPINLGKCQSAIALIHLQEGIFPRQRGDLCGTLIKGFLDVVSLSRSQEAKGFSAITSAYNLFMTFVTLIWLISIVTLR